MTVQEFGSLLFEIRINAHIAHLQITGEGSYAQHKALGELYDDIVKHTDDYIEAYQGQYDIIKGYKQIVLKEGLDIIVYLNSCLDKINSYRESVKDGYLQQLIDNIIQLVYTTIYKLKFLS